MTKKVPKTINSTRRIILGLILLFSCSMTLQAQQIKGKVTSSDAGALPGVSVRIEGSASGTVTDINGNYSIKVPAKGKVLKFTYIGYQNQLVSIGDQTTIDVIMQSDLTSLNEVVVIAYGTAKKKDLTGATASVSAAQIAERQPVTLTDALEGQAAGVLVTTDGGDPASQGTIQIRGASTINANGNGPLYVVDGVIVDNANFINPSTIETIDILKDASSAAIYGARGANGVILITTKKGVDGKPLFNVSYTHTFGKLAHKLRTTSADELRYYRHGANADSLNPYLNADNDYQDMLLRTGNTDVISMNASGGQKGFTYYTGLTFTNDQSIVLNSYMKRLQAQVNVDYTYSKLKISNHLSFMWDAGNIINVGNTVKQVFEKNPWTSIYKPDGSLAGYIESKRNPVAVALLSTNKNIDYMAQDNTQLTYQITKDLLFTTTMSASLSIPTNIQETPAVVQNAAEATGSNSMGTVFKWQTESYFNYTKTVATNHLFTGMVAFSADKSTSSNYRIGLSKYLDESLFLSNSAQTDVNPANTYTNSSIASSASVFGRLGYSYMSRYLFQATWRRDGSSRFGTDNQWGNFLSSSAAWRFSDEKFMSWAKSFLADGKFRVSYGQTGNDAIGNYTNQNYVNFGEAVYNGVYTAAMSPTMGNPNIKWETTTSDDAGLELTLFKGRMNVTADYYVKTTSNLLYSELLPVETGLNSVNINLGSIQNHGLEITVGGLILKTPNFSWNANGNITFEKRTIKELANHTSFISGDKWLIKEGGSIGDFYVWKNLGVYQWDQSNAYDKSGKQLTVVLGSDHKPAPNVDANGVATGGYQYTENGKPYTGIVYQKSRSGFVLQGGDTQWLDLNNDGVIDDKDKVIGGNALPTYYFGITNMFKYKNFSLSFSFTGQIGGDIYNKARADQNTYGSTYSPPIYDCALTVWQNQGDITKYPIASRKDTRGSISSGMNSLYIEDGSFIRLQNARLNYTLDAKVAKKFHMAALNVFVYGNNLLTWTNYSWYDPEFTSSGLNIGQDGGTYPRRREVGMGLNLNF
jgi:TonB-linked SusC/RagA family outer membrane protein